MYRKLMFLISLVALLSWAGAVSADDVQWDGEVDLSWHTAGNWAGDALPGTGDRPVVVVPGSWNPATDPCYLGPVITSNVTVAEFRGPAWEQSDVNQVMTIDGATLTITSGDGEAWNRDGDFENGVWIVDLINGGSINVNGGMRWPDHGTFTINIGPGSSVTTGDQWRGSDEDDGYWILNLNGGTLDIAEQIQIGDSGTGEHNLNSGTVNCQEYLMIARGGETYVNIAGATVNVDENFILNDDDEGDAILNVSAGSLTVGDDIRCGTASGLGKLNVSGGTVTAGRIQVPEDNDAEGRLNQTGGLIETDTLYVQSNGLVTLDGGELRVTSASSLDIDGSGKVNIIPSTGLLKLLGDQTALVAQYAAEGKMGGAYVPSKGVFRSTLDVTFDGTWTIVTALPFDPDQAWAPNPGDGAINVGHLGITLSWEPGDKVGSSGYHDVYLGTDYTAVDTATPPSDEFVAHLDAADTDYGPIDLDNLKTYYWRVDELDSFFTPTKGEVWTFTTGCEEIPGDTNGDCLLNFEDFADVANDWGQSLFYPDDF